MFGRRRVPIGSVRKVMDDRTGTFENNTCRAHGVPLRCSQLAETITSFGNRYAPDARPSHSQVRFAAKISALGSAEPPRFVRPNSSGLSPFTIGLLVFVAEYDPENCQRFTIRLARANSMLV